MKEMVKAAQKLSPEPVDIDMLGGLGGRDVRSGVHTRCHLVQSGGDPRLRDRRPLLRGDRTRGAGPPGQILTPKEVRRTGRRPVPTPEERKSVAKAMEAQTPDEWKRIFPRAAEDQGFRMGDRGRDRRSPQKDMMLSKSPAHSSFGGVRARSFHLGLMLFFDERRD